MQNIRGSAPPECSAGRMLSELQRGCDLLWGESQLWLFGFGSVICRLAVDWAEFDGVFWCCLTPCVWICAGGSATPLGLQEMPICVGDPGCRSVAVRRRSAGRLCLTTSGKEETNQESVGHSVKPTGLRFRSFFYHISWLRPWVRLLGCCVHRSS